MQQVHQAEVTRLVADNESLKKKLREIESEYSDMQVKFDRLEERYIEKDEMGKRYEEENLSLAETCKILQNQLEDYGDN